MEKLAKYDAEAVIISGVPQGTIELANIIQRERANRTECIVIYHGTFSRHRNEIQE